MRSRPSDRRGRFDSLRRDVEYPSQHKRDRKPDQQERDDDTDHRVGNLENRKDLGKALRERPAANRIRDRDAIDFSPLHFFEEAAHSNRFGRLSFNRNG